MKKSELKKIIKEEILKESLKKKDLQLAINNIQNGIKTLSYIIQDTGLESEWKSFFKAAGKLQYELSHGDYKEMLKLLK